jgi:hypothetical protein
MDALFHVLFHPLLELLTRFPKFAALFSLILALASGCGWFASWRSFQSFPQSPVHISLAQAPSILKPNEDLWVEIDKVKWDCKNIIDGEAIFTDESQMVLGVALFSRGKPFVCNDLPGTGVSGVLSIMDSNTYNHLAGEGFSLAGYQGLTDRVYLCTFCGPENAKLGMILCVIFLVISIVFYPLVLLCGRSERPGRRSFRKMLH